MCPSLAAYSCRDSCGLGAQAPHRIPIYARLIGHRRDQWHRNPGAGCGYNVRNRLCQRRAMRRTEGGEGEGLSPPITSRARRTAE